MAATPFLSVAGSHIPQPIWPAGYQEFRIHDQPAVLVDGGPDSKTHQWAHPDAKTILWTVDGVQYAPWTSSPGVSAADLIAMAESTP